MPRPGRLARRLLAVSAAAAVLSPAQALADNEVQPRPQFPSVLWRWELDPLVLAGVALSAALYLWGIRRVRAAHPRNPWLGSRTAAFLAGLGVLLVALVSPFGTYDGTLFSVHMAQHLLLTMVAAPLLVLGTPVSLVVRAVGHRAHRRVLAVLHSKPVALLTHPLIAWAAFAAMMWGSHFSSLYELSLEHPWVHDLEHAGYLLTAILFWWPVVGLDPSRWRMHHGLRMLYTFLQMPQNTFLALSLYSTTRVLYPHYADPRNWGPSALDDQRLGGAIMWISGDLVFLVATGLVLAAWMRHEERVTARIDVQLARERAARSAAESGGGA